MPILRCPATSTVALLALLLAPALAAAQLRSASEGPVVYGHHHLTVRDVDAQKRFWIDTLGGKPDTLGTIPAVVFDNVIVLLRQGDPAGGTKGTIVNHVGFGVPDLRAVVDRVKAAGYPIVTRQEMPPTQAVEDDLAYVEATKQRIAYVMAPDDVKVELVEMTGQAVPITMHHVHYYTRAIEEMKAWYVKTFGAAPGMRGAFQAADLPGVNLTFSGTDTPVAGTKGRSLDHIGFEVKNLEAFCRKLEAAGITFDRPYERVERLGIGIAFLTDPWGTYIELTEGLDRLGR
ncbi:MAG: VOC family protein [Vicinamibacterales bacterium]